MSQPSFVLLKPEERLPRDHPNGGDNLIKHFNIAAPLAEASEQKPFDYLSHVPGDTRIYKGRNIDEAEEMGLSSLAGLFPAANRPPIQAIPAELLNQAFSFSTPGGPLSEDKKGVLVPSMFQRDANGLSPAAPAVSIGGEGASVGEKRKKDKKEKKEKKEKSEKSEKKKHKKEKKEKEKKKSMSVS